MLEDLRPSELGYWAALWGLDPWGEQRADLRAGLTTLHVANAWLKRDDGRPFDIKDFLLFAEAGEPALEPPEVLSGRLRAALLARGKKKPT